MARRLAEERRRGWFSAAPSDSVETAASEGEKSRREKAPGPQVAVNFPRYACVCGTMT